MNTITDLLRRYDSPEVIDTIVDRLLPLVVEPEDEHEEDERWEPY